MRERKVRSLDRQEPPHIGALQPEKAGDPTPLADMYFARRRPTEQPEQQVEQVNADVGNETTGTFLRAFPGMVVPMAASGDVSHADVMDLSRMPVAQPFSQRNQTRVQAQLQHRADAASGFLLQLFQRV